MREVGELDRARTELPLVEAAGLGQGGGDGDVRHQRVDAGLNDLAADDVIEAVLLVLKAPLDLVSGKVFNIGSNSLNYQKIQLVNLIKKLLPQTEIEIKKDAVDPRSYKVSFDKVATVLDFKAAKSIEEGIVEIKEVLERHNSG